VSVDLVSKKAFVFKDDGSGGFTEGGVPRHKADVDAAPRRSSRWSRELEKLMDHFFEARARLTDDER